MITPEEVFDQQLQALLHNYRVLRRRFALGQSVLREYEACGSDSMFGGRNLPGAIFAGECLEGADFRCANLEGADFRCANLEGADFRGARLDGADFFEARLRGARFSPGKTPHRTA